MANKQIYTTPKRTTAKKDDADTKKPIYIRFSPQVLEWARAEAERTGKGYQTVINDTMLLFIKFLEVTRGIEQQ